MAVFEIKVAAESVTNDIVVVDEDNLLVCGNTTYEQAFDFCAKHMRPADIVQIGRDVFSQQVIVLLNVAIKGGIAILANPLPMPTRPQPQILTASAQKLTQCLLPDKLARDFAGYPSVQCYHYRDGVHEHCLVVTSEKLTPWTVVAYYRQNETERWTEDGSGYWNDGGMKYVRLVQSYLAEHMQSTPTD